MKNWLKKTFHKLQEFDFFWSLPLGILGFFTYGWFMEHVFYDPMFSMEYFHAAVLAVLITIAFNAATIGCLYFGFRGIYRYFLRKKNTDINNDFKNMPSWLKVYTYIFIWGFLLYYQLDVFKTLLVPIQQLLR